MTVSWVRLQKYLEPSEPPASRARSTITGFAGLPTLSRHASLLLFKRHILNHPRRLFTDSLVHTIFVLIQSLGGGDGILRFSLGLDVHWQLRRIADDKKTQRRLIFFALYPERASASSSGSFQGTVLWVLTAASNTVLYWYQPVPVPYYSTVVQY